MIETTTTDRRAFLAAAASAALLVTLRPAQATPASMKAAINDIVKGAAVRPGRVKLDVPPLVENGNTVPLTVAVESAMTDKDHVVSIHIFNEKNPQPNVGNFYLGPRAGRAQIATRMRLSDTQTIIAIAKLSDGSFWSDSTEVVVTLAACTEEAT